MERITGGYGLLEAARWYPETGLVFSDMTRGGVYALAPGSAQPALPGVLVPHRKAIGGLVGHRDGGWVIAGRNVAHKSAAHKTDGRTTVLLEAGPDEQFFNDLTADRRGRVYVGSVATDPAPDQPERGPGRLYRLDLDGSVAVLADDVLVSNGLGTSPDDTWLYHVDTPRQLVWAFDLDDPARRTPFVDTGEYDGVPDGLAVAADGSVWVAFAGGGVVVGWNDRGERIAELAVPQWLVTSVCFGGPDLRTLYVLTGHNAEHPDPDGGCVYATPAPVPGLPAPRAAVSAAISESRT